MTIGEHLAHAVGDGGDFSSPSNHVW